MRAIHPASLLSSPGLHTALLALSFASSAFAQPAPDAPAVPPPPQVPAPPPAPDTPAAPAVPAAGAPDVAQSPPAPAPAAPVVTERALAPAVTEPAETPPATEVPAPQAGAAATEAEPTAAELDALVAGAGLSSAVNNGPTLQFYGFADFTYAYPIVDDVGASELYFGENGSFAVGNLNLYAAGDLTGGFRSLFEVRFTYLPNGAPDQSLNRTSTEVTDPADAGRTLRWGGIEIERVFLEYQAHSLLMIRGGQYLTPYGIWNVDHGSPSIIPIVRPWVIGEALFPERQTGLEVYGTLPVDVSTFGYHVTLSNGRGNVDETMDFDDNKAIGGRLFFQTEVLGTLRVGVSGYKGRATRGGLTLNLGSDLGIPVAAAVVSQYDELSYAADLLWKWEGLHLQSEVIANEVAFVDEHRGATAYPTGSPGLAPDFRRLGGYVLAAYRLPWVPIMPYAGFEWIDSGTEVPVLQYFTGLNQAIVGGLNIRPTGTVTLKAQYQHTTLDAGANVDTATAQAAWAF